MEEKIWKYFIPGIFLVVGFICVMGLGIKDGLALFSWAVIGWIVWFSMMSLFCWVSVQFNKEKPNKEGQANES